MRVVIIVAPYGPLEYPVLGPSLLKAGLARAGVLCSLYYASLEFAARIGFDSYLRTYWTDPPILLADRTFAKTLFGEAIPPVETFWREVVIPFAQKVRTNIRRRSVYDELMRAQMAAEAEAVRFVEEVAASDVVIESDVVGLSSSFGQNVAALAIAKRVKERYPEKTVIMGGANCEGVMGRQLLQSFPFLDYVCLGAGDRSFPMFMGQLGRGVRPRVAGILGRESDSLAPVAETPLPVNMDDLPYPDYDDFFDQYRSHPNERFRIQCIPVEGARGCWWGEKRHCIFCGINGLGIKYRCKSARRLYDEINSLVRKYRVSRIWATDNALHVAYFKELIPMLQRARDYDEMFFEVKANLRKEQLKALADAGVTRLQPGIESLSTPVLRLVNKGVTTLQNLQTLKWAKEFGIQLQWNIICGFPGEEPTEYRAMAKLMQQIPHLPPPKACSQITIDRFSPIFDAPEAFGVRIFPAKAYRYVYDLDSQAIRNIAYFYSQESAFNDTTESLEVPAYAKDVFHQREIWQALYERVRFEYEVQTDSNVVVWDTRPGALVERRRLVSLDRDVFLLADKAITPRRLRDAIGELRDRSKPSFEAVSRSLKRLAEWNYVYHEDGRYLTLATARGLVSADESTELARRSAMPAAGEL